MEKKDILKMMKNFYGNQSLKFPSSIDISVEETKEEIECTITLDYKYVKEKNMQINCNAFEGWGIVIYTALRSEYDNDKDVTVKLDLSSKEVEFAYGHFARFLYRAQRFEEQYEWFKLSDELKAVLETKAKEFDELKKKGQYWNNIPKNKAGIKKQYNNENIIEAHLAEGTLLKDVIADKKIFDGGQVYRQLPVGLFKGKVEKKNGIFPGGKSAIDLWSLNKDTFYVVELKTKNPMVGIITEIFFYTNYMWDLLIGNNFTLNCEDLNEENRGYSDIQNGKNGVKRINGIMLADKFHPTLENKLSEILEVMNSNGNKNIHYDKAAYKYELVISKK